jgi:beta-lactamase class A
VLTAPAPREVSFGRIAGRVPPGTYRISIRAGDRLVAIRRARGGSFDFRVDLPLGETTVRVSALDGHGRRSAATVASVFGLPQGARPRATLPQQHERLARRLRSLVHGYGGTCGIYVQDLRTGDGAAWNARGSFPAASTLKVAIGIEVLRSLSGKPIPGSALDRLLRSMLVASDNGAANALEVYLAGSTSAGGRRVNSLLRSLGLIDSDMYGGYLREISTRRRPIPLRVDERAWFGRGKRTTAYDMARLLALVHLATERKGRLARAHPGFSPADARYLLYLLAHANGRGQLDRFLPRTTAVLHKAGWLSSASHDVGLVYRRGGVFAVAVLTYGSGRTPASAFAGRVAEAALDELG